MHKPTSIALLALSLCALAIGAQAQTAPAAARADPLDPNARVPALNHSSSFALYLRLAEDAPISWREANDHVTRIGGWRVYAREAQQSDPAPASKPGQTPNPASAAGAAAPAKIMPMHPGHSGQKAP